jgi:mono/diheme cytochrome c family protein
MIFGSSRLVARVSCIAAAGLFTWLGSIAQTSVPAQPDYSRDIQPIFAKSCYGCHGPKSQLGGLRLDARTTALAGGQSGKVIVPGDPSGSILLKRISSADEQARMPMGGKPLASEQIAIIKAWIAAGATWPDEANPPAAEIRKHWAFIAPVRPPTPAVSRKSWVRTPIDAFILARLDKEGLRPSPEADRATLLRRLSLDLIGLPPSLEEIDAFLADKSPKAYEKQVERLLASPHYGERWARIWLDAARYADSNGYEKDAPRFVWFYRDWVINAFNHDLPYNQFVIEQIAGDMLPNATQQQLVATGFLRNSMLNEEGGVDPEQFRMEAMFDRMEAIGKGILGVTIQCAQCHNHKYDPLTQEEYYRIFAFLNDTHEANPMVYTPEQQKKRAEVYRRTQELEAALQHSHRDWMQRMTAWEDRVRNNQPPWTVLHLEVEDISTGGEREIPMKDGSMLAQGYAPTGHKVKFTAKTDMENITAMRLELMTDPNLPAGGPGRSTKGTGALSEFQVEAAPEDVADAKFQKIKIAKASADINLPETRLEPLFDDKPVAKNSKPRVTGPVQFAIDGSNDTAWGIDAGPGLRNQSRKAVFNFDKPVSFPKGTVFDIYLAMQHGGVNSDNNENNNLGRIRLSITNAPDPQADPVPQTVRDIFSIPREQRTPAQLRAEFSYWRTTVPEWSDANQTIAAIWREYPEGVTQLVLNARNDDHRETHILKRGDFLQPDRMVQPGVPAFLHPLPPNAPVDRLAFARWLVDRKSPTTARSIVNRIWQSYFGTGIVATAENFGTQCEPPANQALLDWMAVEFMDSGWSLKKLHRTIVLSSAYRQSSVVTPELLSRDPDNRLIARGARLRVDAELVRDVALSASGLLNPQVGGPSVYPPAPSFLFEPPASYSKKTWKSAEGPDRYRRALYTFRFRSVPYPALQAFDSPNGESSCVRRSRSNTPLQALTTLNEPLFVEAAKALAERTLKEGGATDEQRIAYAFRRCVARPPTREETAVLLNLLNKQKNWTAVSRVILNLDETITKE